MRFLFDTESFSFARRIGEGDEAGWHEGWKATAQRVAEIGEQALASGCRVSAREALLRVSNYYRTAAGFLLEQPATDPEATLLSARQRDTFAAAAALFDTPVEDVAIPYEDTTWVFGADSFADVIRKARDYTLDGIAHQILAPTLIMNRKNVQFLKRQPQLVENALTGATTTLVALTESEGGGEHTHAGGLGRAHEAMLDWLDSTLAGRSGPRRPTKTTAERKT